VRQVVATRLETPTDLAVTRAGVVLFAERMRGLSIVQAGRPATVVFAPEDLNQTEGGGMLALAADPDFGSNRFVYVLMRSNKDGKVGTRVVRITLDLDLFRVVDRSDILVVKDAAKNTGRPSGYNLGGVLRFGPDGYLYVGIGDHGSATSPQVPHDLRGKILRVDRNGAAASDVPRSWDPRVYAIGLRDPVAIAFPPKGQWIYVADRRGAQRDAVVTIRPGDNAAWDPRCKQNPTSYCDAVGEQTSAQLSERLPRTLQLGGPGERIAAMASLSDVSWVGWRNLTLVAYERATRLDVLQLDPNVSTAQAATALEGLGVGIKAVVPVVSDVYALTAGKPGGDEIWRLSLR
jgi:aldose sugar dehydrogenase